MTVSLVFILGGFCTGFVAGFLGGLLGIGGGIVVVPALMMLFELQGIKGPTTALAVGTSLATIVFTSASAARAQIKRGAVRWDIVRTWAPFVLIGSFTSGFAADYSPDRALKGFIGCFLLMVAIVMLRNWQPAAHRQLPGIGINGLMAATVGLVSGLVGIGGGQHHRTDIELFQRQDPERCGYRKHARCSARSLRCRGIYACRLVLSKPSNGEPRISLSSRCYRYCRGEYTHRAIGRIDGTPLTCRGDKKSIRDCVDCGQPAHAYQCHLNYCWVFVEIWHRVLGTATN